MAARLAKFAAVNSNVPDAALCVLAVEPCDDVDPLEGEFG